MNIAITKGLYQIFCKFLNIKPKKKIHIDDVKKELQKNFNIAEMNDTSFSIFWGNNKELNEMFAKLNSIGIKVKMLNSENTLRASIMQSINNNKSEEK